jgi:hypothetical protein
VLDFFHTFIPTTGGELIQVVLFNVYFLGAIKFWTLDRKFGILNVYIEIIIRDYGHGKPLLAVGRDTVTLYL